MKTCILFFSSILLQTFSFAQDSLTVTSLNDTVFVRHVNAHTLCGVKFVFDVMMTSDTITIIERDTSVSHFSCRCGPQDIVIAITGVQSGEYVIQAFRQELKKYNYETDTTYFMCSTQFSYESPGVSSFSYRATLYECGMELTQEDATVYFNSFECSQDTAGWQGYGMMEFRSDAPQEGGEQSLFISGGCIWPHALIELPPLDEAGSFIVRCWGKNLMIGGGISIEEAGNQYNYATITINDTVWTFYQSAETLHCEAGEKIYLSMGAGGIAPSAILIDRIEIAKVDDADISTEVKKEQLVDDFALSQNYPNPFNPVTTIGYTIPSSGYVSLKVYDILGREVAVLMNGYQKQGKYSVTFNASELFSGIYFYSLGASSYKSVKKMLLIK